MKGQRERTRLSHGLTRKISNVLNVHIFRLWEWSDLSKENPHIHEKNMIISYGKALIVNQSHHFLCWERRIYAL